MDIAKLETLYAPTVPHQVLFTYTECYAQVERSMRIHRFARLGSDAGKLVMFFCQLPFEEVRPRWLQMEIDPEVEVSILTALKGSRVPILLESRGWTSIHHNRSLRISTRGASIALWWDSMDNELGDAIRPLCNAINSLVKFAKVELEKYELLEEDADEKF